MTEPATLISLAYHSTVPGTQDEIHTMIENAFERFGVTDAAHASFGPQISPSVTAPAVVLAKVKEIAASAVELRTRPQGSVEAAQALEQLSGHTVQFFDMVASWLAAELATGVQQPDQPISNVQPTLLNHIYFVLYSSAFREVSPGASEFNPAAWDVLSQAVQHGSGPFGTLREACQTLCGQLAAECNNGNWVLSW